MSKVKVLICPYCGETQPAGERCRVCSGLFEPFSRQATMNAMGPWHVRDENRPYQPGCSYETLIRMVEQGRITRVSILRGPTTKQLWQVARRVPGIAHLMGYCHNCDAHVDAKDLNCPGCGAAFGAYLNRNHLGLPDLNPLPWDVDEDEAASSGAFRQYFTPPKLQATGLSSFAHDEELVDTFDRFSEQESGLAAALGGSLTAHTGNPAEHIEARATSTTATARMPATTHLADSLPEFDSYAAKARQRALERRLKQQRNLVRIFGALFFITAFFALALQLDWIGTREESEQNAQQNSEASQPADDDSSGGAMQPENQGTEDEQNAEMPAADPPATLPTPGGPGAVGGPGGDSSATLQSRDNRPQPYRAEYERAMELVKRSMDDASDLDQRINDVTQAVQILVNIRDTADESLWPEGLVFEIKRQERRIEELKQSKFFG